MLDNMPRDMIDLDLLGERTVIGWGASVAAVSTLAGSSLRPAWFVDANPAMHGATLAGVPVRSAAALADWLRTNGRDNVFVIVFAYATRAVRAIFGQLAALGLEQEVHYTDCSVLHQAPMTRQLAAGLHLDVDPQLFAAVRQHCLASTVDNRSSIAGTWLIQTLLRHHIDGVDGDIAEAGVYKGGSALTTLELAGERVASRPYHLFDSFAGLDKVSAHDPTSRAGEFADVTAVDVARRFAPFANVHIHAGLFAERFADVADRQFSFVYVDCDLYEPAVDCCTFFYPRLAPGGVMLFHDYWVDLGDLPLPAGAPEPFTGIRRAVDELVAQHDLLLVRFPETTHALVCSTP